MAFALFPKSLLFWALFAAFMALVAWQRGSEGIEAYGEFSASQIPAVLGTLIVLLLTFAAFRLAWAAVELVKRRIR